VTDVVLVDAQDREVGRADKHEAHRTGALHRAVSVFVFDGAGRLLVQQRAEAKYHSAGLWSNSACTHPRPGESTEDAARRCLEEEMGVRAVGLEQAFSFVYRAAVTPGLIEHELDHVFVGSYEGEPAPAPVEVSAWRLDDLEAFVASTAGHPELWTPWCVLLAGRVQQHVAARRGVAKRRRAGR
jgi:isopentenyl-diphosphate delta-isomerase